MRLDPLIRYLRDHIGQPLDRDTAEEIVFLALADPVLVPASTPAPRIWEGHTFQLERIGSAWPEVAPLFEGYWAERGIAAAPFDLTRHIELEQIGRYRLYTARREGEPVAMAGVFLARGDTGELVAQDDKVYARPDARRGWLVPALARYIEGDLASLGVRELRANAAADVPAANKILRRRGYAHRANLHIKTLEAPC